MQSSVQRKTELYCTILHSRDDILVDMYIRNSFKNRYVDIYKTLYILQRNLLQGKSLSTLIDFVDFGIDRIAVNPSIHSELSYYKITSSG